MEAGGSDVCDFGLRLPRSISLLQQLQSCCGGKRPAGLLAVSCVTTILLLSYTVHMQIGKDMCMAPRFNLYRSSLVFTHAGARESAP